MQAVLCDHAVEHLGVVEAVHHHEPVDHLAGPADGEAGRRTRQRHHVVINAGGQAAVEPKFRPACCFATSEGREIGIGKTHRLFELVGATVGEKNFRHMRLATGHLVRWRGITVAVHQKSDLIGKRRLGGYGDWVQFLCRFLDAWRKITVHAPDLPWIAAWLKPA